MTDGNGTKRTRRRPASPQPQWPADQVERRKIADLVPNARNARVHSDEQVERIVASMKQFGWTIPCLIGEDGDVIAGHGRILAAEKLGWEEAPTMVARGWSEAQKRAYRVADNRLSELSTWDKPTLLGELNAVQGFGIELGDLGFDAMDLKRLAPPDLDTGSQLGNLEYSVVIRCKDEAHQAELLTRLEKEGLSCQALIS